MAIISQFYTVLWFIDTRALSLDVSKHSQIKRSQIKRSQIKRSQITTAAV